MSPILAEVSDVTIWSALAAVAGFVVFLVRYILKDKEQQRKDDQSRFDREIDLREKELTQQQNVIGSIKAVSETLADHIKSQERFVTSTNTAISKMSEAVAQNTRSVDKLCCLLEKRETERHTNPIT